MASLSKADSRRMYSWWWNSHISPKNSKWLQENLTDVDIKVKAMIKLIEEDADSFARRAEMYYKKRPELMKLVEELYRAYRALAERYDHATGALRQAHKTMTEAFPNQIPAFSDDSSVASPYEADPQTPDSRSYPGEFHKDEESDAGHKGSKQSNELLGSTGTARRTLKFDDSEDGMTDKEILVLKEALAKLEEEKEAEMQKYLESLERLSKLESEIINSQEDSRELADRASKAKAESQELKDALQRLETEKEESLELCNRAQEKIEELGEKLREGVNVTEDLKQEIAKLQNERDSAYDQFKKSTGTQSELEKKLVEAESEVKKLLERAEKAEREVEKLKLEIVKLTEEKEAQVLLYQKCLETISSLELRLACAEEESKRLNSEIDNGVTLLKDAEEQRLILEKSNRTLHLELETMGVKFGTQTLELTEKQKELGRLWTCIQEERLRFVEAETAFQTLQQLHSQSQEELRSLAAELQNKAQILRDIETRNEVLQGEIQKHVEENKKLNELNLSSAISLEDMQTEIFSLKESNGKLEEEVGLRVDQRNALQQEIYCLKEELNSLNKNHGSILEQVAFVGLNAESLGSSVKKLQDENANLKEEWKAERTAKEALLEKLKVMGQLLERNDVLENSLSDLGAELEGVRGKLKSLEESYQSLSEEKSNLSVEKANLLGQLQVTTENLSLVSEKNTVLENSLFDAHVKLEVLKQQSKIFEDEKSALITEKGTLVTQMEITEKTLKDLEVKYSDLEEKYSLMDNERESTLRKVEELHYSLSLQNQEHVAFAQKNDEHLHSLKSQLQLLQQESRNRSEDYQQELDKSFGSEIEIFVLMKCVQDLEEQNFSLFNDCNKLQEASKLSESLVHVLKNEKSENQVKIKSLSDQNNRLRTGIHQLLKVAGCGKGEDEACFDRIQRKFESTNCALIENEDKNMELTVEVSILVTLLRQFKSEIADLEAEKCSLQQELLVMGEKILVLQTEAQKLSEINEELRLTVSEGDDTEKMLRNQLEDLHGDLLIVQGAYKTLQTDNSVVIEEKKSLSEENVHMNNRIRLLEEESDILFDEVLSKSVLSETLKKYIDEKHAEISGLDGDLQMLHGVNNTITEKMSMVEKKLEEVEMANLDLKKTLEKSKLELVTVISNRDQLNSELVNGKDLLHLKETEHKEAVKQLMSLENDKTELSEIVAGLQREYNEVKMTRDEQGKQILKLSEDNDRLSNESGILEVKLHQLTEKQEETEEKVRSLETEVSEVYGDLQTYDVYQVLLEEKIRELTDVCMSLQEESTSKDVNNELLKERTHVLECENGDLKAHLAAYGPALDSLRDCIVSLENNACIRTKVPQSESEEEKGAESVTVDRDAIAELQDLQSKVKVIEKAVIEMQMLTVQEKLDADAKLESAMKQIEELINQKNSRIPNGKPKSTSEISEADPKDIMLDQASECSSYGVSKRGLIDGEIWEKADNSNTFKHHPTVSEISLDNDFDMVDKLEVSKRFKEPRDDGNKRKVLERLNSDVQKLTNLQITIEDLKRKVEITSKSRRGKAMIECETLKGQLMEAESAIQKLYELNGKLVKHIEGNPEKSTSESGESEIMRRKKVSEQARRVSEKIGRLQLEIQKIQFVLLKLDDENDQKGKARFLDANKRVLLKDYLYGGGRTKATVSSRRKKSHFCGCVEPSTKGD